jgi:glycosyltransferase involved in cell wall biosynthesis
MIDGDNLMDIRVFTDLRFTSYPRPTGVGRHIFQMVHGLSQIRTNKVSLLAALDQICLSGSLSFLPICKIPMPWKLAKAAWTLTGCPAADRWCGGADWVYCPKNDFIPVRKSRVAVTIHGASELDPDMPKCGGLLARLRRLRSRATYVRLSRQADLILTVSEFLRRQVVEWFDVDAGRVRVVGNGVEADFFEAAKKPRGCSGEASSRPFILCVGGLNHLDGGDRIIKAAHLLKWRMPDLRVIVAGCQHEEEMRKSAAQLPNVTLLGYVSSRRLACHMRDALALLYPTRYETFGIAAAEAMAVGTPIVTCRSTAVPEVVGDAAIYVDPDRPESIVEAMTALQSPSAFRDDLIGRGHRRAEGYRWSACVSRLQQALEQG